MVCCILSFCAFAWHWCSCYNGCYLFTQICWIKYITLGIYLYAKWKSVPLACGSWAMVHYLLPALGIYPKNLGVYDAVCIVGKEKGIKRYPHWIGNLKHVLLSLFQLFLLKSILSEDGALFLAYWDDYFKWLLSCRKNFKWHSSKLHMARISFWTG